MIPKCKRSLSVLAAALVVGIAPDADATNTIALSPDAVQVDRFSSTQFTLTIDFDEVTLGGGVVIGFDPQVAAFLDFSFDAGFGDDPGLRLVCPDAGTPACAGFPGPGALVAFASASGITGAQTVGTLTLYGAGGGITPLTLAEDSSVAGPFVPQAANFDDPVMDGASLEVIAAVPTSSPAGRWLLALALLGGIAAAHRPTPGRRKHLLDSAKLVLARGHGTFRCARTGWPRVHAAADRPAQP